MYIFIFKIFSKERLIKCVGIENLNYIDKIKMIKCFKERSNFGIR